MTDGPATVVTERPLNRTDSLFPVLIPEDLA